MVSRYKVWKRQCLKTVFSHFYFRLKPDYNYLKKFIKINAMRGTKEVYIFTYRVGFQESYGVFPDLNPAYQTHITVGLQC